MKKAVAATAAALLLFMGGIAVGRYSLLQSGAVLQGGGQTAPLTALALYPAEPGSARAVERKININTAGADALGELPGVGPTLAGRIVDYRRENGAFQSLAELKAVRGIGDGVYARLEAYITLGD